MYKYMKNSRLNKYTNNLVNTYVHRYKNKYIPKQAIYKYTYR